MKVRIAVTSERSAARNGSHRGNAVETFRRAIASCEENIARLKKHIVERQRDCAHNLTLWMDEEFDALEMDGSQTLLVHKDRVVQVCCLSCSAVYNARVYGMGNASCLKCFQRMTAIPLETSVLVVYEYPADVLGLFRCDPCDLSILIYSPV